MNGNGWVTFDAPSRPGAGPIYFFIDVEVDAQDHIYWVDNQHSFIARMDDMQGHGLITYGSLGGGVGQFNNPDQVSFDNQGRLYIPDELNHRIVRINDMTGSGWTTFGSFGTGIGQFAMPEAIALDKLDRIYIAEPGNARITRINSMAGDGWVSFGTKELQGVDFQIPATKAVGVFGQGPAIPYLSIFPQIAIGGGYRTSIVLLNGGAAAVSADLSF